LLAPASSFRQRKENCVSPPAIAPPGVKLFGLWAQRNRAGYAEHRSERLRIPFFSSFFPPFFSPSFPSRLATDRHAHTRPHGCANHRRREGSFLGIYSHILLPPRPAHCFQLRPAYLCQVWSGTADEMRNFFFFWSAKPIPCKRRVVSNGFRLNFPTIFQRKQIFRDGAHRRDRKQPPTQLNKTGSLNVAVCQDVPWPLPWPNAMRNKRRQSKAETAVAGSPSIIEEKDEGAQPQVEWADRQARPPATPPPSSCITHFAEKSQSWSITLPPSAR